MSDYRIGIVDHGHTNWQGGQNYLLNLREALRHPAVSSTRPFEVVDVAVRASSRTLGARLMNRLSFWSGIHQPELHRAIREAGCDFAYYCATGKRSRVGYRSAHWIADFQSLIAPEFSPLEYRVRSQTYIEGVLRDSQRVILSSRTARQHCELLYPNAVGKTWVLPFRATTALSQVNSPPMALSVLQQKYSFAGPFMVVLNQWWRNKNHACIWKAMDLLGKRGRALTVLCTGDVLDGRDPGYADEIFRELAQSHADRSIRVLGKVPREELVGLLRHSNGLIQPSLFEGWSTSVEEARCLGKTTILSDIPVHREQASPYARYFDPSSPESLADQLDRVSSEEVEDGWDSAREMHAASAYRSLVIDFAESFLQMAMDDAGPYW